MRTYLVGLTGGIGSGKSAAADRFAEHGIELVDADIASRAVVEPGEPALGYIANHFGKEILLADGSLNRAALRAEVFASDEKRHWLQSLLHPLINEWINTHVEASTSPYTLLVNPLLIETRQHQRCKAVIVVDVPEALQIERTMARDNNSREQVENIIHAQASRETRLAAADIVLTNDQDLAHLFAQVDQAHETVLSRCQIPQES